MAEYTNKLELLKKNPIVDGNDTFNIETMLNENWDKIDGFAELVEQELSNVDDIGTAVSNLIQQVGDLTELDTDIKKNLIAAINEVYRKLNEHKAGNMPHIFISNGKTYRYGFSVENGVLMFNYEEVL